MDKSREMEVDFGVSYVLNNDGTLQKSDTTSGKTIFIEKSAYDQLEKENERLKEFISSITKVYCELDKIINTGW